MTILELIVKIIHTEEFRFKIMITKMKKIKKY